MECYRSFSPNGIVPQKLSSWSMLFGNMPVLRADYDINDVEPKDAAVAIVNRIREREGLPFHWFRNIIKSPTWYVEVVVVRGVGKIRFLFLLRNSSTI